MEALERRIARGFEGTLFCIPGFLGRATDWDPIVPRQIRVFKAELFSRRESEHLLGKGPLSEFTLPNLAQEVNDRSRAYPGPRILAGYSLGGRIALRALLKAPTLWDRAIIISAHPGLSDPDERAQRLQSDSKWAERFESNRGHVQGEWDSLISDWNSQPVFQRPHQGAHQGAPSGNIGPESFYSRHRLAAALRGCSLAHQQHLTHCLSPDLEKQLSKKLLWVVGEDDSKFLALAKDLAAALPWLCLNGVPQSGHRILRDQPEILKIMISSLLGGSLDPAIKNWNHNQS